MNITHEIAWRQRLVDRYTLVIPFQAFTALLLIAEAIDNASRGLACIALGAVANGLWMYSNQRRLERQITRYRAQGGDSR